jgi:class 3 adenylate cyclase
MDRATLFLYAPAAESVPAALVATGAAARAAASPPTPELAEVAVLVADLQDAGRLWRQLPAPEYFELVHEIWAAAEPVLRAHGASLGRHPGDGLVAYFLARSDRDYLVHALAVAQQLRESMRQVSAQWQQRKGWTTPLCLNSGIAEGQEWIGSLRPGAPNEWTVLGDAAEQAALMARLGRGGAVWATRSLVGKLARDRRAGLQYGAPRPPGVSGPPVAASFARLQEVAGIEAGRLPPEFADLAIAEVIALASTTTGPAALPGARPHL